MRQNRVASAVDSAGPSDAWATLVINGFTQVARGRRDVTQVARALELAARSARAAVALDGASASRR